MITKNNPESFRMDNEIKTRTPILAVLVLYKTELSSCITLSSLCQILQEECELSTQFKLLIYDNSPSSSNVTNRIPIPFVYIHDASNSGLVQAYNRALQMADEENSDWLLLLDQDTVMTAEYLQELYINVSKVAKDSGCAALVPKLVSNHKLVSPNRVLSWGRLEPVAPSLTGIAPYEIMALNSGTLLRVNAIRSMGGFNSVFWLDFLDHWIFNRLYTQGYPVYILNAVLIHDMSLSNMPEVSIQRYRNILLAEGEFYLLYKSKLENIVYCCRLLVRVFKRLIRWNEYRLCLSTLEYFFKHTYQTLCQ